MLSVMGAFAEFEQALIRERQLEGIALAKQQGKYRGRKKALSPDKIAELQQAHALLIRLALLGKVGLHRLPFGIIPEKHSPLQLLLNRYSTAHHTS